MGGEHVQPRGADHAVRVDVPDQQAAQAGEGALVVVRDPASPSSIYFGFFFLNFLVSKISPGSDLSFW